MAAAEEEEAGRGGIIGGREERRKGEGMKTAAKEKPDPAAKVAFKIK